MCNIDFYGAIVAKSVFASEPALEQTARTRPVVAPIRYCGYYWISTRLQYLLALYKNAGTLQFNG